MRRRPTPDEEDAMDAKRPAMDAREPRARSESWLPRKPYSAPRLTKHGSIVTETATDGSSRFASDRALKDGLAPVDPRQVLAWVAALPIATWSYQGETVRHLGPMAQDFSAAFSLGADDRHIHVIDASGVALTAIQGLHALVQAQATRLATIEGELAGLRGTVDEQQAASGEAPGVGASRN
jgi:hypothetical protein